MFYPLIRKARRSARYVVLSLLVAAVFLAGIAYANAGATVPSAGGDAVIPIQNDGNDELNLFPTKPVRYARTLDDDQLAQDWQLPADHENCVTGGNQAKPEPDLASIVAPRVAPESDATQQMQLAYMVPYIPSLSGK